MIFWKLWVVFVIASVAAAEKKKNTSLFMKVKYFMSCPDMPKLRNTFKNVSLRLDPDTEQMYVSGILSLKDPVEQGMMIQATINKCVSEDEKSCSKYWEFTEKDFCGYLPQENKVWSTVVASTKNFVPDCPVPPGEYVVQDGLLDTSMVENLDALTGFWQVRLKYFYKSKVLMCTVGNGELRQKRRKKKKQTA